MAMCPATFVVRLADHRVRHLTRIRVRARDDRVWGETLRGGCPGQDSNLHGSCLPWDFKLQLYGRLLTRTARTNAKTGISPLCRCPLASLDAESVSTILLQRCDRHWPSQGDIEQLLSDHLLLEQPDAGLEVVVRLRDVRQGD